MEICHTLVPEWDIRTSANPDFNAATCDAEVMAVERELGSTWKMALTTTEFLCAPNLSSLLDTVAAAGMNGAMIKPVAMVDTAERTLTDDSLVRQCHTGFVDGYHAAYKSRMIHRHADGAYSLGRHGPGGITDYVHHPGGAMILWFGFAPWCEPLRRRKLQIQHKMPDSDKTMGLGGQHLINEETLNAKWQELVGQSYDLRSVPEFVAVTA